MHPFTSCHVANRVLKPSAFRSSSSRSSRSSASRVDVFAFSDGPTTRFAPDPRRSGGERSEDAAVFAAASSAPPARAEVSTPSAKRRVGTSSFGAVSRLGLLRSVTNTPAASTGTFRLERFGNERRGSAGDAFARTRSPESSGDFIDA